MCNRFRFRAAVSTQCRCGRSVVVGGLRRRARAISTAAARVKTFPQPHHRWCDGGGGGGGGGGGRRRRRRGHGRGHGRRRGHRRVSWSW